LIDGGGAQADSIPDVTPRKDLAGIFADEEKTSDLADLMNGLSVKTPRAAAADPSGFGNVVSMEAAPIMASTSDEADDDDNEAPQCEAAIFREQATAEGSALEESSLHWTKVAEDESLGDELRGEIRAAVGQAKLLYTKRVAQFLGLCDLCDDGPEDDGPTAGADDLEGFWAVIMMQVRNWGTICRVCVCVCVCGYPTHPSVYL
jgi:hypothetical protein